MMANEIPDTNNLHFYQRTNRKDTQIVMNDKNNDEESVLSEDSDVAFAFVDFDGVDFGGENDGDDNANNEGKACKEEKKNEEDGGVMPEEQKNLRDSKDDVRSEEKVDVDEPSSSENADDKATMDTFLLDGCKSLSLGEGNKTNVKKSIVPNENVEIFQKIITQPSSLTKDDEYVLNIEKNILLNDCTKSNDEDLKHDSNLSAICDRIRIMSNQLCEGEYIDVLSSTTVIDLFRTELSDCEEITVSQQIRNHVMKYCTNTARCVEVELVAVAALNLFLQVNYTGPSLHHGGVARPGKEHPVKAMNGINPHKIFRAKLNVSNSNFDEIQGNPVEEDGDNDKVEEPPVDVKFHNAVLAELSVDGEWPCPVCKYPYLILLARSILLTLAEPNRPDWSFSLVNDDKTQSDVSLIVIRKDSSETVNFTLPSSDFVSYTLHMTSSHLWSARAAVAHVRLLQADEPSTMNLSGEVRSMFQNCKERYCDSEKCKDVSDRMLACKVLLEFGLSEHHFDINKKGKPFFEEALKFANLDVKVTGAEGRRTKYQQKATAQMLVKAKPTVANANDTDQETRDNIGKQFVDHQDETILLDKVKYIEDENNEHFDLSILQQTVLLALCLDVKNKNPMDGLTGEEMGAFLERVLQQSDDWMVYATGLLERAWLESERNHTRERAILQIQALADQHSNRLTLTQSTFQAAVEDSAPPQDRLRYLHYIVYPPRWAALRDLAERYAKIGIVTSAAELFEEIELWDDVVECYRRAGKENKAEQVVRKRLEEAETPRMWAALGDITKDTTYYERALELSKGKYSGAYIALGKHYSEKGDFENAAKYFKQAVMVKPLSPNIWFQLGAMSMRLEDWSTALQAFTEVVQQEPEEGDAWANVAAIHMHNREPLEAYPALNESLKLNRNNWRVWVSKLYTCMDLKKLDEAVQACQVLIEMKSKKNAKEGIPDIEERIVRGIVVGTVSTYQEAIRANDAPAVDSAKRSLTRVRELLSKLMSTMKNEPWLYEISAFFHESIGCDDLALDDLMKEYRSLQSIRGWETDKSACPKLCQVVAQISDLKLQEKDEKSLKKFKILVSGVVKKIKAAYFDESKLPMTELNMLNDIMERIDNTTL